jgi:hypothetical protein
MLLNYFVSNFVDDQSVIADPVPCLHWFKKAKSNCVLSRVNQLRQENLLHLAEIKLFIGTRIGHFPMVGARHVPQSLSVSKIIYKGLRTCCE